MLCLIKLNENVKLNYKCMIDRSYVLNVLKVLQTDDDAINKC